MTIRSSCASSEASNSSALPGVQLSSHLLHAEAEECVIFGSETLSYDDDVTYETISTIKHELNQGRTGDIGYENDDGNVGGDGRHELVGDVDNPNASVGSVTMSWQGDSRDG